jgi:hypothetical protein
MLSYKEKESLWQIHGMKIRKLWASCFNQDIVLSSSQIVIVTMAIGEEKPEKYFLKTY